MNTNETRFRFRFHCGPSAVEEVAEKLDGSPLVEAFAGTEHVYGYVRLPADGDESTSFAILAKDLLGWDPGRVSLVSQHD